MVAKNHMIVEFFRNNPNGENGVFEVLSDFNIYKGLKDS